VKNSWAEGWEKIRIREELGIWLLFPWEWGDVSTEQLRAFVDFW
jgi:hypothetical protein